MCGIAGIYSFELFKKEQKIKKLVIELLKDIEIRGRDATGISLINSNDDEINIFKTDVNASDFINKKKFHKLFRNITDYNIILLHTRFKTHGDEKINENNHPHFNKKFNNVLVHNGMISNYIELKEKHKDIKLSGECDSEIILELFNKKKQSIKNTLKLLSGSIALGLFNKNKLYLYAHDNPLKLCHNRTRNLFLFSSHSNIFDDLFTETDYENELFTYVTNKEDYAIYDFYEDDLISIKFKNKKIIKEDAKIKEEELFNNITVISEKSLTNKFIEDELENEEKEKKLFNSQKAKFDDEHQYLTMRDYNKVVEEEYNNPSEKYYNAYGFNAKYK